MLERHSEESAIKDAFKAINMDDMYSRGLNKGV